MLKFLMVIITVLLILICQINGLPYNDNNKPWECYKNQTNYEDCLIDILPVIMNRYYYINKIYKDRSTAIKLSDIIIKPKTYKSKCTRIELSGLETNCIITNFNADLRNQLIEFDSYNPELKLTASCVYEKDDATLNENNANDIVMTMYEPPIKHSMSYGVDKVTQKIFIGEWTVKFKSDRVFISETNSLGVRRFCDICGKFFAPDRYSILAFKNIKEQLENNLGKSLRKIANQVRD